MITKFFEIVKEIKMVGFRDIRRVFSVSNDDQVVEKMVTQEQYVIFCRSVVLYIVVVNVWFKKFNVY